MSESYDKRFMVPRSKLAEARADLAAAQAREARVRRLCVEAEHRQPGGHPGYVHAAALRRALDGTDGGTG